MPKMSWIRRKITELDPRTVPIWNVFFDAMVIFVSIFLSLFLRLGSVDTTTHFQTLWNFIYLFIIVRLLTMYIYGLYRSFWKYSSVYDFIRLAQAIFVSGLLFISLSYLLPDFGRLPRSLFFIDLFISIAGLAGVRILSRMFYERANRKASQKEGTERVLIYGAGENGRSLANRLRNDKNINQFVVGFIDDDLLKKGKMISGFPVLGTLEDLENIIASQDIDELIVSISHPSGVLIRQIIEKTRAFNIMPRVVNNFSETAGGNQNILREISLNDLLSRKSTEIDVTPIRNLIHNHVVFITGAGGSIGSEIARQVSHYKPRKLILIDHSELNLYNIDKELRLDTHAKEVIIPVLIDIKDKAALEAVFAEYKPQVIYHAAAYKHVHLVELNPYSAILNNISGTLNLLELSQKYEVSTFLNISTDKAVNPVGLMGATKRVSELMTSSFGFRTQNTYCSCRFGNVLGSSGSLIPLLQKQLQDGKPLTITHKDMKRFFMLIPEAVSLVLTSSVISKPGDISILNMGDQVRILDLAESLITLSGKKREDVEIIFTGLRPGEKMFEEMYLCGNEIKTLHPDILTIPKGDNLNLSFETLAKDVVSMIDFAKKNDARAVEILRRLASVDQR